MKTSILYKFKRSGTTLVAVSALLWTQSNLHAERDFRLDPPRFDGLWAEVLDQSTPNGNALVIAEIAQGEVLPPVISVEVGDQMVELRDDGQGGDRQAGDGSYSAVAFVDFQELAENQQRVAQLTGATSEVSVPTFAQRERLEDRQIPMFDFGKLQPGIPVPLSPPMAAASAVDPEKSLLIRHPSVVEDPTRTFNPCTGVGTPMGKWTFGYLMKEMANQSVTGINPSVFVRKWLAQWQMNHLVNNWPVNQRPFIQQLVIDPWELASGGPGAPLDLSKAPFKLLAIVNRVDLRNNLSYGSGSAGEARFVFGVIDRRNGNCFPTQFTVILEYGIDKRSCADVRNWGLQWYNLNSLALGSPAYNAALEAITQQFVVAGAAPHKPNQSALNQLRSNEIALAAPWELREFVIRGSGSGAGHLWVTTAKQTPGNPLNFGWQVRDYINANVGSILGGTHVVPLDFPGPGMKFLAGSSFANGGTFWDGAAVVPNRQARHLFSLNTCNACHAGETATAFTHVKPVPFGVMAPLSGFMTGINVTDPADGFPVRHFNDLARRALDLDTLVNTPCVSQISTAPLAATH